MHQLAAFAQRSVIVTTLAGAMLMLDAGVGRAQAPAEKDVGVGVGVGAGIGEERFSPGAAVGSDATKLSEEAFVLYRARDYRHAVEMFIQAYALDQDPNLLFNIAHCYEAMGDTASAIEKYESFLAKPDADPVGKQRAEEALRGLRADKNRPTHLAAVAPAAAAGAASPATVAVTDRSGDEAAAREKSAFWGPPAIVLATGILVAVAGTITFALGASDHDKVTGSPGYGMPAQVDPMTQAAAQRLVQSGDTKELIGGIAIGVGGALVATSAILFAIRAPRGSRERDAGASVALRLDPSPRGGRFVLEGRF